MSTFTQQWIEAWNSHQTLGMGAMRLEMPDGVSTAENRSDNHVYKIENIARTFFRAFPDLHYDVLETVEQDSKLALLWHVTGTHKGKYNNIPATGKRMEIQGASFFELKDGKMVKACFLWDEADMLRQMSLLPDAEAEHHEWP